MSFANIDKPSKYFTANLHTGTGSSRSITGLEFAPEMVWFKGRSVAYNNHIYDIIRGTTKAVMTNLTNAETTYSDALTAFNSDGYTIGANANVNESSATYVSWNWKANGTGVSNTQGTITSTVSANTTSGFSVVSFDLTGQTGVKTVGHGLGTAPKVVITKRRSGGAGDWTSYFGAIGNSYLVLNSTAASATSASFMNNTAPTSSVFTVGDPTWWSQSPFIAYCFAEVKGFSKAFSYTGNGSSDGVFVNLGFKPAWVMVKASSTTGQWAICDNRRGTANTANGEFLFAESSEATNSAPANWDFLSNGLKARAGYAAHNSSGVTYIGIAFATNPFVSSKGIPACAV